MPGSRLRFAASLPERAVRATVASLGGVVHESAQVLLPRVVRNSHFYEATAKNALRIAIEAVGGVEASEPQPVTAGEIVKRKAAGNVVEIGSIAAFGFSPLWLLAAASDALRGSRVYLETLVDELRKAGVVAPEAAFESVDDLLAAFEGASGRTAGLLDVPPLELVELRATLAERRPLLEVSTGMGMAILLSARSIGHTHLFVPYREDWRPLRSEGFAAYARRVSQPYGRAVAGHFDPARLTWTERLLGRARRRR